MDLMTHARADLAYEFLSAYLEQDGTDDRNLTPRMLIKNFDKEISHAKKVMEVDLQYPIELYLHKGKRIILDGVHRFTKAVRSGHTTIKARKISEEIAQKTKRTEKKYKKQMRNHGHLFCWRYRLPRQEEF